ncbi:ABC transporter permease [Microbacterium marinilacus]|uniref:Molybdenum transport system permease n=1 Tax=Microbacterium marinilacus TaxID=415209 RepID=A0ABP7BGS7_9MICO|nr:ABC transporter permease [Microbacterium marinilacus]MBY0688961.1 ABC transporter permease [Microbacterium marinilacus]
MTARGGGTRIPGWLYIPAAAGAALVLLPLAGLLSRVDWPALPALLTTEASLDALWLSVRTAALSTAICVVLGVPLAFVLARSAFRGLALVRAVVLLPLVLPPVVGGLALLYAFGRNGLLGEALELGGIRIGFTTTAVVLAQAFVSLPFLVLSLEGALRLEHRPYELVAATLGASPSVVLRRISLPLMLPALISGAVLAFARSLGEFGATLTFAGSYQGTTRTLPLEIYLQREVDPDVAVALSLLLVIVALVGVLLTASRQRGLRT